MKAYRPLPKGLTIGPSEIEGLGLFTLNDLVEGMVLGISHVPHNDSENFHCGLIRTPLGGFINHSENSNIKMVDYEGYIYISTTRNINAGEELVVNYKQTQCGSSYINNFNVITV